MPILGCGIKEKAVERRNRLPITYTGDGGAQASRKGGDSQPTNRGPLTALSARPAVTSGLSRCEATEDGETRNARRIVSIRDCVSSSTSVIATIAVEAAGPVSIVGAEGEREILPLQVVFLELTQMGETFCALQMKTIRTVDLNANPPRMGIEDA